MDKSSELRAWQRSVPRPRKARRIAMDVASLPDCHASRKWTNLELEEAFERLRQAAIRHGRKDAVKQLDNMSADARRGIAEFHLEEGIDLEHGFD